MWLACASNINGLHLYLALFKSIDLLACQHLFIHIHTLGASIRSANLLIRSCTDTHTHTRMAQPQDILKCRQELNHRPSHKWLTRSTSWTKAGPYEGDTLIWTHFVKLFMRKRKTIWKNTFIWITHCSGKHAFKTQMHSLCGLRLYVLFTTIYHNITLNVTVNLLTISSLQL